ncbi:hypothetical protein GOBAR_DD27717 [Gossypium barbadense]|nr:hypothetical protein GOBAR_DD27717 [Gossypium barbadense]
MTCRYQQKGGKLKLHALGKSIRTESQNGDTYAGEYFADKMHGFGVYCFANGHQYEGAWHEGRRQGLGMYTFRSGETQFGHWQNGILDVPSTRNNTYPISPVAVYRSKVLNVAKVDERVNKAVASQPMQQE